MEALTAIILVRTVTAAVTLGLAVASVRARPRAIENRLVALLLVLIGATMATTPIRHLFPPSFEREMWSAALFRTLPVAALGPAVALAGTMRVPLALPFARPVGQWVALAAGGAILVWGLVFPGWMITMRPTGGGGWTAAFLPQVAPVIGVMTVLVSAYVAAVSLQAMLRAPRRTLERARAMTVLVAITLLTAPLGLNALTMLVLDEIDPALHIAYMDRMFPLFGSLFSFIALLAVCTLVWGMLRVDLYDVDLRVKWSIRRGTVGAVFIAAFFVVAQLVQGFFSDSLGWAVGGVFAGLLLFALRPIERFAARFADAAMPSVEDTPEWRAKRRAEIYATAVRLALADRRISREEETHLADLATELGLDARSALDLRRHVEDEVGISAP